MASQTFFKQNTGTPANDRTLSLNLDAMTAARVLTIPDRDVVLTNARVTVVDTSGSAQSVTFDGVAGEIRVYRQSGANALTINRNGANTFPGGGTSVVTATTNDTYVLTLSGTGIEVISSPSVGGGGGTSYAATIGNGTDVAYTVTHNLGTKDVMVQLRRVSDDYLIQTHVDFPTINTINVEFSLAPTSNSIRVIVFKV